MKIQKRLSRKYKGKEYYKYLLVLPEKELEMSGFNEGEEISIYSKKGEIRLRKE